MPRFFFSTVDHRRDADDVARVLPDLIAAKREAIIHAGKVMQAEPHLLGLSERLRVQIHDENRRCLAIVGIQILDVDEFD